MESRPPRFTKADAEEAASWILKRRQGVRTPDGQWRDQDPDLVRAPADPRDLRDVVQFVSANQRVSPGALRDDALAVLVILDYLQSELDRLRLSAIRLARAPDLPREQRKAGRRSRPYGLTWQALAAPLRVRSAQGAEQMYLRLVNLFEGVDRSGAKDERQARAERQGRKLAEQERSRQSSAIRAFAQLVLNQGDTLPERIVTGLETYATELDPSQRSRPVSTVFAAQVSTTVVELLALEVDGRLREAIDHVAPLLGIDVDRKLWAIREGLLEGVVGEQADED